MRRRGLLTALGAVIILGVVLTGLNLLSLWQINGESGTFSTRHGTMRPGRR